MTISQWLEHYLVVIMALLFAGIVVATYWPGRKDQHRAAGPHSI